MITKPKDAVENKRFAYKKKHLPYTSLGVRQTIMVLHNLGKSKKEIASALGCKATTIARVFATLKKTG